MTLRYLSVCSGIEAASCAWEPLGWRAVAFSEIEPFPCSLLAHRFPHVPNWGDMTSFQEWPDADVDVLVGGTPCQSFSVAGLRQGLADPRGNLALTYLAIAARYQPRWVVWENVPGVFSALSHDAPDPRPPGDDLDGDDGPEDGTEIVVADEYDADEVHAFGCFMAGLQELGYGVAYRVLDAQFFGVPQRRRRVFVVGHLGSWAAAAAVLSEPSSLRGDPPPRRAPREGGAGAVAHGAGESCGAGSAGDVAPAVTSKWAKGTGGPAGDECQNLVAEPISLQTRGSNLSIGQDVAGTLGTNADRASGGAPMIAEPIAFDETQITHPENRSRCAPGDPAPALARGARPPTVAFNIYPASGQGADLEVSRTDLSNTLDATAAAASTERGTRIVEAAAVDLTNASEDEELAPTLQAEAGASGNRGAALRQGLTVRRLTPRECERLQGFADDWTLVPHNGKPASDSVRYRAIGNSMPKPVMEWIGRRLAAVDEAVRGAPTWTDAEWDRWVEEQGRA